MSLFGKKENNRINTVHREDENAVVFKVLGSGCKKCHVLEANVHQACQESKLSAIIEHEKDFAKIASYGVMSTPALVLNEEVVSSGKVLSVNEIKTVIKEKIK